MHFRIAKSIYIRGLLALVLSLAIILATAPSGVGAQTGSALTMKVEAHFSGHYKFGEWLPLRVTLANDGPSVKAEVRCDAVESGGQTVYVAPVELPSGARKQLTLYVQPPSYAKAVRVRLLEGERELASQAVQVTVEQNINYVVGVVAPRSEPFATLSGLTLNDVGSEAILKPGMIVAPNPRSVHVVMIALADIPGRAEGLRGLDALVISGMDTSPLTLEQGHAMESWVGQGGRLVLGGGAAAARTLAGLPATLLGDWRLSDSVVDVSSLEALGAFADKPVRVPGPFAAAWPQGDPAGDLRHEVLVEQDGHALVLDRELGDGHITYVALDVAASPYDAWAGALRFWENVLTPGSNYPPDVSPDVSPRMQRANTLAYALQNLPSLELPSIRWLAILLIVYVVFVGPLNYLALRWRRRLEWGWVTIPALTLLFSAGTFALGFNMRGGDVILNKISVLVFDQHGVPAPMQTYVGIFSPARQAYTLNLPGGALVSPLSMGGDVWSDSRAWNIPGTLEVVQGEPTQVRGMQVNQWSMQAFVSESLPPADWRLESDLVYDGQQLKGQLVNRTGETILDAAIVNGNRFVRLGDLPPGQVIQIDHALSNSSGASFPYFLYEYIWQNAGPTGPPRELQVRQQVLDNYYGSYRGMPQPPSDATLIGWMRNSPFEIQVQGTRWATQQTSLFIATLDLRIAPGPIHLSGGSVPASLLEVQGDAGICGSTANEVYANNGVLMLAFQLPREVERLTLTRLSLVMNNSTSTPTVELLTRQGEWVTLENFQLGSNEVAEPERFILADGTLHLRMTGQENTWMGCARCDLDIEGVVK